MSRSANVSLWMALGLFAPGIAGCVGDKAGDDGDGDGSLDTAGDDDDEETLDDTGTSTDRLPCADGWGLISDPDAAVHVAPGGDDAGEGSIESPFATLDGAIAHLRAEGGEKRIAVWPGTYATQIQLLAEVDVGGTTDDGTVIEGCSAAEVTLEGAVDDAPVVELKSVQDVELTGLTVSGGTRGVFSWDGATSAISNVAIERAREAGFVVSGGFSLVSNTVIRDITPVTATGGLQEQIGYGIAALDGTLDLRDTIVQNATGAGLFASGAVLDLQGVEVSGTLADSSGLLGRGMHLQGYSEATLVGVQLTDNADAGLFSLRSLQLDASEVTVTNVAASTCPGCDEGGTGDGIVVTRGESGEDIAYFQATLTGNTMVGVDRAGMLLSGVTAEVSDNQCDECGYQVDGSSWLSYECDITGGNNVSALETGVPTFSDQLVEPAAF